MYRCDQECDRLKKIARAGLTFVLQSVDHDDDDDDDD